MKLEEQVCSLELGEKIDGLGVRVDGLFVWAGTDTLGPVVNLWSAPVYEAKRLAPAYTVAELGAMLYAYRDDPLTVRQWRHENGPTAWYGIYADWNCTGRLEKQIIEKTEADARAKMLIWLLENGHITAEEINGKDS